MSVNADIVHKVFKVHVVAFSWSAVRRWLTMGNNTKNRKLARRKTKLDLPDLDHAKAGVLATLCSPESQRSYRYAIDEFVGW
jgi:hypothetical protein